MIDFCCRYSAACLTFWPCLGEPQQQFFFFLVAAAHGVFVGVVPRFSGERQWLSTSIFSPLGFSVGVTLHLAHGPSRNSVALNFYFIYIQTFADLYIQTFLSSQDEARTCRHSASQWQLYNDILCFGADPLHSSQMRV